MKRTKTIFWLPTLILSGLILASIFLAPLLLEKSPAFSGLLYQIFSSVCHQRPERSFFFTGQPLAVCSRCLGFYSGFFFGVLTFPFMPVGLVRRIQSNPSIILVAAGPLIVDAIGILLGLWTTPLPLRLATGFAWAWFLPFFWLKALFELKRK